MTQEWSVERARQYYSLPYWSEGYFDIDSEGAVVVQPHGPGGPSVRLSSVVEAAGERGLQLPVLIRFADILGHKLGRMQAAFGQVMAELDYQGGYTAVFPIKVNQQRAVVSELVRHGSAGFGLEAGSKPELMAVLALSPGGTVICNGYKDREYIRLALIGRKLGLDVHIVIEKANELGLVIEEAAKLGVRPLLGVRMRLASIGHGKWQNTGGDKAKFGLMPRQLLDLVDALASAGMSDCLRLVHFHMGSQISNVRDIASGMREAARYFVELRRLGLEIDTVDVGGGLGVDYEGTRSRSDCSVNYGLTQYAQSIVAPLAEACTEHGLPHPRVITESGRSMTAHHAVLVADVTAVEQLPVGNATVEASDSPPLRHLRELHADLNRRPPQELYHEAAHHLQDGQARFALGQLSLADRAALDDLHYAILHGVRERLRRDPRNQWQLLDELEDKLSDKYFVNLSVFQSMPDVWALEQVFPILPLERLNEQPDRRAVLEDLTCDSDGRIDRYVDDEGVENALAVHRLRAGERYCLAVFLVGAYQETLGDIHNLFGDTDSVSVRIREGRCELVEAQRGDSTDRLLGYVGYDANALRMAYRARIAAAGLAADEAKTVLHALEAGFAGYTYLHDQ
ncbi:MAG: biosynthetic arginine decarboxylase [Lysobacterales bacterium]